MRTIIASLLFLLCMGAEAKRASFLPNTFSISYEKLVKTALKKKIEKHFGTIDYKYPGHIRYEQMEPQKLSWVSNPKHTWYYQAPFFDDAPGELQIYKTNKESLSSFFDVLVNGLKSNQHYTVEKKKEGHELIFDKKSASKTGISRALLVFKNSPEFKNMTKIILTKNDKKKIELDITKIDIDSRFEQNHFIFIPPENTRINN